MKKKIRKLKKLIYSHQIETLTFLISFLLLILGCIILGPLVIPFILIIDLVVVFREKIYNFIIKLLKKYNIKLNWINMEKTITSTKGFRNNNIKPIEERKNENMNKKVKKVKEKENKNIAKKKKILKILLLLILIGIIFCFLAVAGFWLYIAKNAPKFNEDNLYKKESSILYDRNGKVFAKLGSEFREKITYDDLPEVLVNAIIATEDSRFFQHNGFDLPRFLKASIGQVLGTSNAGGASTLTMQISKNAFTSNESSGIDGIIRKFTDIYVSMNEIEKNYTKEQILEFYVNSYCLGGNIYGVEQAALSYFGKHAKDLNLSEAAIIAGLYQAPNAYNPISNPENAAYRRNIVLTLMVRHGYITQEEADIANAIKVEDLIIDGASSSTTNNKYQGFIDTVVSEVKADIKQNPYTTAMEIYTTMDTTKQDIVNAAMNGQTYNWENEFVNAGVSVLDTKSGEIVAIGTGRDTSGIGLLNHATFENQTRRQIGSTAKPLYDYGPAIEYNNWSPYNYIGDEPYTYTGGAPITNWDGTYQSLLTARQALSGSRNVPALKVFQQVKNKNILEFATNLGLSPEISGGSIHEAHAIGGYNGESPLTVSAAYSAFANGGTYNEPHSYTKIIFRDTNKEIKKDYEVKKAMKDSTSFIVFDMLVSTSQEAMRGYRNINGWQYGAKTGTSNFTEETKKANHLSDDAINDLWCTGVTDEYAISVWYGYDKINSQYYSHFGTSNHIILMKTMASQIWTRSSNVTKPNSVISVTVEAGNVDEAKLPSKYTPIDQITSEYFVKGSEPTETSTRFEKLSDPKNLTSSYENGVVTLKWTKIDDPNELDKDYLTKYFSNIFKDEAWREDAVNNRYNYYQIGLGGIVYDIYEKDNEELTLITSTEKNTIDLDVVSDNTNLDYVVKTSWKNNSIMDSDGVSTSLKINSSSIIKLVLVGSDTVSIEKGQDYTTGIKVYNNDKDITSSSTISYTILDSNNQEVANTLTKISSLDSGQYTIVYTAKYNSILKKISRKITIK